MTKKRDSEYFKKRLARDHPAIFAEVRSGALSIRAASATALSLRGDVASVGAIALSSKSHSFSIVRTPIHSLVTRYISTRNHAIGG